VFTENIPLIADSFADFRRFVVVPRPNVSVRPLVPFLPHLANGRKFPDRLNVIFCKVPIDPGVSDSA
jgi:hypothetical protein